VVRSHRRKFGVLSVVIALVVAATAVPTSAQTATDIAAPIPTDATAPVTTTTPVADPTLTVPTSTPPVTVPVPTPPVTTAAPQSPLAYVGDALTFIETYGYRVPLVDWGGIKASAQTRAAVAASIADTYPIVADVVKALADKHSSFTKPPEAVIQSQGNYTGFGFLASMPSRVVLSLAPSGPAEKAGLKIGDRIDLVDGKPPKESGGLLAIPRRPDGSFADTVVLRINRPVVPGAATATPPAPTAAPAVVAGKSKRRRVTSKAKAKAKAPTSVPPTSTAFDITMRRGTVTLVSIPSTQPPPQVVILPSLGYLSVPGIVGDTAAQKNFATQLQNAIRDQDTGTRCGWIVDLRKNRGGYIYALLAGLAPLLGDGPAGGTRNARGVVTPWSYRNGAVFAGEQQTVTVDAPYLLKVPGSPVAVLISGLTASAGEASAIFFRGLPNSRSFGEPTLGLTTFNVRKTMSDGAFLDIAASVDVDRNGVAYEGRIPPDEPVALDWTAISSGNDAALQTATNWLRGQPQCANTPA
jgi:carboxyl-terminal processing protease